jgi:hypothetical protein
MEYLLNKTVRVSAGKLSSWNTVLILSRLLLVLLIARILYTSFEMVYLLGTNFQGQPFCRNALLVITDAENACRENVEENIMWSDEYILSRHHHRRFLEFKESQETKTHILFNGYFPRSGYLNRESLTGTFLFRFHGNGLMRKCREIYDP